MRRSAVRHTARHLGGLVCVGLLATALPAAVDSYTLTTVAPLSFPDSPLNFGTIHVSQKYTYAGVVFDSTGALYGTTRFGGANGCGTVFRIGAGEHTATTIATFDKSNGRSPTGSVTLDSRGNIYGTTMEGGTSDKGTVFQLTPDRDGKTYTLHTLTNFDIANGAAPTGRLTLDADGALYGTAMNGGPRGGGTVFKLAPNKRGHDYTRTTIAALPDPMAGSAPVAGLALAPNGVLYGIAAVGGSGNGNVANGGVFALTPDATRQHYTLSGVVGFGYQNGAMPNGDLTLDSHGNLYGTTRGGGERAGAVEVFGTVFKIDTASRALTTIATFRKTREGFLDGACPLGGVIRDDAGNLYGASGIFSVGVDRSDGTIYKLTPDSAGQHYTLTRLATFPRTGTQQSPMAGLTRDSSGALYGISAAFGPSSEAQVYKLTPNDAISAESH